MIRYFSGYVINYTYNADKFPIFKNTHPAHALMCVMYENELPLRKEKSIVFEKTMTEFENMGMFWNAFAYGYYDHNDVPHLVALCKDPEDYMEKLSKGELRKPAPIDAEDVII